MAVQNVDLVKPMLDQAFTFALLAMEHQRCPAPDSSAPMGFTLKTVCLLQLDEYNLAVLLVNYLIINRKAMAESCEWKGYLCC